MTGQRKACSQTSTYHPLLVNHTHVVTCRRPAGHDGMHEGEGFGNASVVWDPEPPPDAGDFTDGTMGRLDITIYPAPVGDAS